MFDFISNVQVMKKNKTRHSISIFCSFLFCRFVHENDVSVGYVVIFVIWLKWTIWCRWFHADYIGKINSRVNWRWRTDLHGNIKALNFAKYCFDFKICIHMNNGIVTKLNEIASFKTVLFIIGRLLKKIWIFGRVFFSLSNMSHLVHMSWKKLHIMTNIIEKETVFNDICCHIFGISGLHRIMGNKYYQIFILLEQFIYYMHIFCWYLDTFVIIFLSVFIFYFKFIVKFMQIIRKCVTYEKIKNGTKVLSF